MASQITSVTIVYSTVCSGVHHRKHQSSASLACVTEIQQWAVNFPHKGPVTRKMFPYDDVIMGLYVVIFGALCRYSHGKYVWYFHQRTLRISMWYEIIYHRIRQANFNISQKLALHEGLISIYNVLNRLHVYDRIHTKPLELLYRVIWEFHN